MSDEFATIRADLERLRQSPKKPEVWGSHEYTLNPPQTEAQVRAFETKHGVVLPSDYRDFLIHLGNGGVGPPYGVFKLGETDDSKNDKAWTENDGFIGILAKPFPHTEAWNDLEGKPERTSENEHEFYDLMEAFHNHYWRSDLVNGAIPICHSQCLSSLARHHRPRGGQYLVR